MQNKSEDYRSYNLSWVEPPLTTGEVHVGVASLGRGLHARLGTPGAKLIPGTTIEAARAAARSYIDGLYL